MSLTANGIPMKNGQGGIWQAVAPAGLTIVGASLPANSIQSYQVNTGSGSQYGANFYWNGGSASIAPNEHSAGFGPFNSSDFGWLLVCIVSSCTDRANLQIFQVNLYVRETTPPSLTVSPNTIWQTTGWVRGRWPLSFWGSSPSGLCGLNASFAGTGLPGSSAVRDTSRWQQCLAPPVGDQIVTQDYPQGADPLDISAWDAAGETVTQTKTVDVDNQAPTVSLSGPAQASSAAGVQYVTARAAAGPSGVAGISCRVDSGPASWYSSNPASVAVSGLGQHHVSCLAENNAVDTSGQRAESAPASFDMRIGQPTISAIAFSKLVDGLRCHRAVERISIPAHWARVKRGGHSVRIRVPAYTTHIHVRRCRVRTARRRVALWVTVRRNGHRVRVRRHRLVRIVLRPHRVISVRKDIAHGHTASVSGWLGTSSGVALAGQTVDVLGAPRDGRSAYSTLAVATTDANGGWSARIPAGPSRSITAAYAGGATTEGSFAAPIQTVVPARVELLRVSPQAVAWGGTVRLTGRLSGGYLPPGGALLRLRIGIGRAFTTYGVHEHVGGDGRFTTRYTFGAGAAQIHRRYWFSVASLPMGDYPYAPASSRRITVAVGGNPPPPRRR